MPFLKVVPRLESLDLLQCIHLRHLNSEGWGWYGARLEGCSEDLKRRCFEQIKKLPLPDDSTDDYEHISIHKIVGRRFREYIIKINDD